MNGVKYIGPWQCIALRNSEVARNVLVQRLCEIEGKCNFLSAKISLDLALPDDRSAGAVSRALSQLITIGGLDAFAGYDLAKFANHVQKVLLDGHSALAFEVPE